MALSARVRRTNGFRDYPQHGFRAKRYEDMPLPVIGQVLCNLRDPRALSARYRCRTEQKKVGRARAAGITLGVEYHDFMPDDYWPFVIVTLEKDFVTVEDRIRAGVTFDEALGLVGKCAGTLREFHEAGKVNGKYTLTHGDPYLENFRVVDDATLPFDLEHEHPCSGLDAVVRDKTFFVAHAFNVLSETGHVRSETAVRRLMDAINNGYPPLKTGVNYGGLLGHLYFHLRFFA